MERVETGIIENDEHFNKIEIREEDKIGTESEKAEKKTGQCNYNLQPIERKDNEEEKHKVYRLFEGERNQNPPSYMVYYGGNLGFRAGDGAPWDYDPGSRNTFVKIVFVLTFIMLLLTGAFDVFVFMTPALRKLFIEHRLLLSILAAILIITLSYVMACSPCSRRVPCNFVCLILAVVAMSVITAVVTSIYETRTVILAVLTTSAIVFICVLLACSSFDFTKWFIYVIVIVAVFAILSSIIWISMAIFHIRYKPLELILLIVGTVLTSIVLIIELQMILGGRAIELSEDEYAYGAFLLYTSILDIFLKLVQIFGELED